MPRVTVLMPLFNGLKFIKESLDSIQAQTYKDWEFIIVNDFGSNDGCADIVREYAEKDSRIKLVQTEKRLGLAASLNLGLDMARGEYVARVDVDDPSKPERLEKQVAFMDAHQELSLCSSYCYSLSKNGLNLEKVPRDPEELKASLLFPNDVRHFAVMLRKSFFDEHRLRYDPECIVEDYELWTRALAEGAVMANIPEPLVTHRWGFGNISIAKGNSLEETAREISANVLENIGVEIWKYSPELLSGWRAHPRNYAMKNQKEFLQEGYNLLKEIYDRNNIVHYCDNNALKKILRQRLDWIKTSCGLSYKQKLRKLISKSSIRSNLKTLLTPILYPFRRVIKILMRDVIWEISSQIEQWTWERYQRSRLDKYTPEQLRKNFVPYVPGEKIRILFMFQAASFWPSWESFYNSCLNDPRLEIVFAFLDEKFGDTTQMKTAQSFLEKQNIPYVIYTDKLLARFNPHVLILQTPYDEYHRMPHVRSGELLQRGMRIVYIPYGIEIADTDAAHNDHFNRAVKNCWRVYTFSDEMRIDYCAYTNNGRAVRALGHPRFDGLYHKENFHLPEDVTARRQERKIVLWHVHFPKLIPVGDTKKIVTPYLEEYLAFAEYAKSHSELFFIFQAHPKFLDCEGKLRTQAVEILAKLKKADNFYIDKSDDYRACLVNADFIITDRSALMIESGALGVPVLYMSNADYQEPLTEAVAPLVESYEQGHSCSDMINFVERCKKGLDLNKEKREAAFRQCIPYFDGKCGERIKEDIIDSLEQESHSTLEYQFSEQTAQLEARIAKLEEALLNKSNESVSEIDKQIERWTWDRYGRTNKDIEKWTWERYKRSRIDIETLRRQIDYTYRDIMIVLEKQLEFVGKHNLELRTNFPVAFESLDSKFPHGTIRDNTRFPRFIKKCEKLLGKDRDLSFLDLGCSGGGMVLDAILRGHLGIGLEGCDASLNDQRAEWRLLRENLFTCDISKTFELADKMTGETAKFNIITAWEVLEHIAEKDLPQLFENIKKHLRSDGYFISSIANFDDIDPKTGVNWHVTVHGYSWWKDKFEAAGFKVCSEILDTADLARGGYNQNNVFLEPSKTVDTEKNFHLVAQI